MTAGWLRRECAFGAGMVRASWKMEGAFVIWWEFGRGRGRGKGCCDAR